MFRDVRTIVEDDSDEDDDWDADEPPFGSMEMAPTSTLSSRPK